MNQQPIPFVISIAHPDYKRPWLEQEFRTAADKCELDEILLESISTFIYDRNPIFIDMGYDITEDDIEEYFLCYYEGGSYMSNNPWSCSIFTDNKWTDRMPLNADIVKRLTEYRDISSKKIEIESESESESECEESDCDCEDFT